MDEGLRNIIHFILFIMRIESVKNGRIYFRY